MLWRYGRCSTNFSVPRCSRPICGSARSTTSPSISRMRRSTPCAAGCCGPKLIVWLSTSMTLVVFGLSSPGVAAWGLSAWTRSSMMLIARPALVPSPEGEGVATCRASAPLRRLLGRDVGAGLARLVRLLVAREGHHPFPGGDEVVDAEVRRELDRLVDDLLALL